MKQVHLRQFSLSFPALAKQTSSSSSSSYPLLGTIDGCYRPRRHRIPLTTTGSTTDLNLSYEDVVRMLKNSKVKDEYSAVTQEIEQMTNEITALKNDRILLEDGYKKSQKQESTATTTATTATTSKIDPKEWDIQKLLRGRQLPPMAKSLLSLDEERMLKWKRGNCLTMYFQSYKAKEVFTNKFGAKIASVQTNKRMAPGDTITLGLHNCCSPQDGGAANTLQHLELMNNTNVFKTGFFFSSDSGKAQLWGKLPQRLFERMRDAGLGYHIGDVVYLSTGPYGSYYAEFCSGECWWGIAVDDGDLLEKLQEWDVYRVIFGKIQTITNERNEERVLTSWIVLGRDGRVAWKNIPSRLHRRLESRMSHESAPAEVSLGPGDSYFVRFLNGTIDYCLPAEIAEVCESIERQGGQITNLTLSESSHDFVIRHTELR